jgi:hypothetical protein
MHVNTHHYLSLPGQPLALAATEDPSATCSTNEFAAFGGFEPQTARKAYSATGHYLKIRPTKLPDGRLRWPLGQVRALYRGSSHE